MIKKVLATLAFLGLPFSAGAALINLDVYQILQSSAGDPYPESVELTFFNPKPAGVAGRLRITAEGVDLSENDEVRLNGNLLGLLTHQTYNYCCFDIQAGPGSLGVGTTESLDSFFDVFAELLPGVNTLRINIDPGNWIVEIETVQIQIPEPGSLALVGLGLLGLATRRRRS